MEFTISSLIALTITLCYIILVGRAWRYRESAGSTIIQWLVVFLGLAALTSLTGIWSINTELFEDSHITPSALSTYAVSAMFVIYGGLTFNYLHQPRYIRIWFGIGLVWWIAVVTIGLFDNTAKIGQENWLVDFIENVSLSTSLVIGGWVVISGLLLPLSFQKFYSAGLPELANRALFWAVIMPMVLMGSILSASGIEFLREMGWVIQLVGVVGTTYGVISLRVVDIRGTARTLTVHMSLVLITMLVVLSALLIAEEIDPNTDVDHIVLLVGLALATATLYAPIYFIAQNTVNRFVRQTLDDVALQIGRFSEAITGVVELDELAQVVVTTLQSTLRIRRSCLILVTRGEHHILKVEPHPVGMGEIPKIHGWLRIDDPIHKQLFRKRSPLLQFDLDFSREFSNVAPAEREFFQQMRMAAYAPIVAQGQLIGIIACGPKANDEPFSNEDLELLSTIANQTGVALRNARLIDDLRRREHDIAESANRLEVAKRQLEALDAVKTDFITIASHELRTPLAQIRGNTDIIDALNEQGMLDEDQLMGLTNNLRKAAGRLEGLIGDMLDVSQLDLSAMDLRFAEITIESVVRQAIENSETAIRERKQSLRISGLRNLPPIEADMQRLGQAIRNMVLNAVKFTPDGGRIEITGNLEKNTQTGQEEIHLIIRDTGIGIDPKNHEVIFEKFYRTGDPGLHSTGTTKFMGAGPGLGLTIAHGVITGHGGRILVESDGYDPENLPGSTFNIILPLKPPEGQRHVVFTSTGSHAVIVGDSDTLDETKRETVKTVTPPPTDIEEIEETDDDSVVESDPTILNPSASRAGLVAAAMAAAQKAKEEAQSSNPSSEDDENRPADS